MNRQWFKAISMAQPAVIDLYPCETEADGSRVYRAPLQALAAQVASGAIWLVTDPRGCR
jgi:hypothetical protein